jgi:hypothetical protein
MAKSQEFRVAYLIVLFRQDEQPGNWNVTDATWTANRGFRFESA